jgi:phage/plasmid-associated DNA primase
MSAEEIKKSLELFVAPGGVCELRVLGGRVRENGGYFNDLAKMAEIANVLDKGGAQDGIFFTLNEIKPDLLARYNNRLCQTRKPELTKGSDVIKRRWLYVDIDIKGKLSGISSRDSEHAEALEEAATFARRMTDDFGWPEPVYCDSGNGAHLQYRIDLPNEKDSTELVKKTLVALDHIFNHPRLNIDSSTNDPNRIAKLYGTMVRKGEEVDDRHHRQSRIITVPDELVVLAKEQMEELVKLHEDAVGPAEPEPQPYSGLPGMIDDMGVWLEGHGLTWKKTKGSEVGGTIYVLDDCPGCHDQKGSCQVTKFKPPKDGQHAKCHHSSCPVKNWQSLRAIVEPEFKAKPQQPRQERDQNRRARPEMPELDLEDIAIPETTGKGDNERTVWKFSPSRAADAIIQRFDIITTEDDKIWVYRDGYYSAEWWKGVADMVNNVAGDIFPVRMQKELEAKIHSKTRTKEDIFYKNPYLLCCKNCTVNLLTGDILEHSPEHYINSPSAFVYNPSAWPAAFVQLLDDSCFNDIDRMTLVDWLVATCCLVGFEYILFLTGGGSNGKNMYEDVLAAAFPDSTECISLTELTKERFARGQLKGARTNIFNETNVDKSATEVIKALSGSGNQSGDVKNARDRTKWKSFIQLIFDTNGAPRFNDSSYGFKRRFTRVKMPFTFVDHPEPTEKFEKLKDTTLSTRLVEETNMSGILNLIIARAPEIALERKICRREDDYEGYEEDANSFNLFCDEFIDFDEMLRQDPAYRIASSELYNYFEMFAKLGGSPMSQFSFSRKIGERNKHASQTLDPEFGKPVMRGFKGLKFKTEKFSKYIKDKSANILNSNYSNYPLTSLNEENTDRVTSITSYRRIIGIVESKVKDKGVYTKKEFYPPRLLTRYETSPAIETGINSSNPETDNRNADLNGSSLAKVEPVQQTTGEPIVYKERGGKHKAELVCGLILQDKVVDGILYKADQVVYLEKRIAEQLYMKPVKSAGCKSCGKPVVPWGGREDFCKACYRAMSQVKDEEVISMSVLGGVGGK